MSKKKTEKVKDKINLKSEVNEGEYFTWKLQNKLDPS